MREDYLIDLPYLYDLKKEMINKHLILIGSEQPFSAHKAVEKIATYFKREFKYDYTQYTAFTDHNLAKVHSYLWLENDWESDFAIGGAVFRYLDDVGQSKKWTLQFVWFHPYYRRRGLLSSAWDYFKKTYGDFELEEPISKDMKEFWEKYK